MEVGVQRHASAAFPPEKIWHPLYRRLGGHQGRSGRMRKISPPTEIRSPDRPARSESLYRLSYPDLCLSTVPLLCPVAEDWCIGCSYSWRIWTKIRCYVMNYCTKCVIKYFFESFQQRNRENERFKLSCWLVVLLCVALHNMSQKVSTHCTTNIERYFLRFYITLALFHSPPLPLWHSGVDHKIYIHLTVGTEKYFSWLQLTPGIILVSTSAMMASQSSGSWGASAGSTSLK